jgi:hypothetical protein
MRLNRNSLLTAAMLFGCTVCWGQHRIVANVPFDFASSAGRMPAGHYDIVAGLGGNPNITRLRHEESNKSVLVLSPTRLESRQSSGPNSARLVFHCGDSGCSLSEIWPGNGNDGWYFIPPRKQSELKTQVAMVTVPANRTH